MKAVDPVEEAADRIIAEMRTETDEHGVYDDAAIVRFAKAARSWMERGSPQWNAWLLIEHRLSEKQ